MAKKRKYEPNITEEWQLYDEGVRYKHAVNLYKTVDENYRNYLGDQWRGVKANGLSTPVYNVIKPVVRYKISTIMANATRVLYTAVNDRDKKYPEMAAAADALTKYAENIWEEKKLDFLNEQVLLDALVSGDGMSYWYYDTDTKEVKGDIVDSVNIFPGDVNDPDIEEQPYIILSFRAPVGSVMEEARENRKAKKNALTDEEIALISPDDEFKEQAGDFGKKEMDTNDSDSKCLCMLKLWRDRETKTIWMKKATKQVVYYDARDTGQKLYPIAHMNWEPVKNSFFGCSDVTGLISNQQYINKIAAIMMMSTMYTAFPKMVYDADKVDNPSNQVGVAIGIKNANAQSVRNIIDYIAPASMSSDAYNMFNTTIRQTKELMGAGDSALGLVNPEQASGRAIMATMQATAVPLESNRRRFYNYIEDIAKIWFDIWAAHAEDGKKVKIVKEDGSEAQKEILPEVLEALRVSVKIDVGPDSRFSGVAAEQTLENLLMSKFITFEEYVSLVSDKGTLPKKKLQDIMAKRQMQKGGAGGMKQPMPGMMPGLPGMGGMDGLPVMPGMGAPGIPQIPGGGPPTSQGSGVVGGGMDPKQIAAEITRMPPDKAYGALQKMQRENPKLIAVVLQSLPPQFLKQLASAVPAGAKKD